MSQVEKRNRISKSAVALLMISVIAVFISFWKESVVAYYFGTSQYMDAYNISVDTPRNIFDAISAAIASVVIPVYTKELLKNKNAAEYFFRNFTPIFIIPYIVLIVISEGSAFFIIKALAPGAEIDTFQMAVTMFRMTIPSIGLGVFCKINTGILNSHKSFLLPAFMPVFFNVSIGLSVLIFGKEAGVYAATFGTVVGMVLGFILTCFLRRKYVSYKPALDFNDKTTVSALKMAGPVFLGSSATEFNLVVDRWISSFFETGSLSALHYASRLSSGISHLFIVSITTVVFPELAESIANNKKEKAADIYIVSIRIFMITLLPIVVGGVFLGEEIMALVYGRGAFGSNSIAITTPIFTCYFISLLFMGIRQVGTNYLYSCGESKIAMKNTIFGVIMNILLDIILSRAMGVSGVALATTISVIVISILLMRSVKNKNLYVNYLECLFLLFQVILACGIMFMFIWVLKELSIYKGFYDLKTRKNILVFVVMEVLVGAFVYFLVLFFVKVKEMKHLFSLVANKFSLMKNGGFK